MMRPRFTGVVLLVMVLSVASALAIVRRHDRSDNLYRADPRNFPALALIHGVEGTLVAPRWVLTAGHAFEEVEDDPFAVWTVELDGQEIPYDKIVIHPKRRAGSVDSDYDLALLRLTRMARINPVPLYHWDDEPGRIATLVGTGASGVGLSNGGPLVRDGHLRRATNKVEAVFEHSLLILFDTPPAGTDLEGIPGAGDSGGPAFLERDGKTYLAGVVSFNTGNEEDGSASKYESLQAYARVSGHVDWITRTIEQDPASTVRPWSATIRLGNGNELPHTIVAQIAAQFLTAVNRKSAPELAAFYAAHGGASIKVPQDRARNVLSALSDGPYEMIAYRVNGDKRIGIATVTSTKKWVAFSFALSDKDSARLAHFSMETLDHSPL